MAVQVDLDLQRYIERKKGAREALQREGAAYAYGGDLRYKGTLDSLRPVTLATETAVRLWRQAARGELLGAAVKASPHQHARAYAAIEKAAQALHVPRPAVYVAPGFPGGVQTLGTDEEACVVLDATLAESLTEAELVFALARECGHIQNDHVALTTALYYLAHDANRFLKWVVTPASLALKAWSRRAEITCDRAGLIGARDLDVAAAALAKLAPGATERDEALRLFADSHYYRALVGQGEGLGGLTQAEVDGKVGEVLSR